MESSESNEQTAVPRFLDDLNFVERKRMRLDSKGNERWSLNEKKEVNQILADMGVAILDGDNSAEDDNDTSETPSKENIENCSPNSRSNHKLKKSFHPNKNSPLAHKNPNVNENTNASKNPNVGPNPSAGKNANVGQNLNVSKHPNAGQNSNASQNPDAGNVPADARNPDVDSEARNTLKSIEERDYDESVRKVLRNERKRSNSDVETFGKRMKLSDNENEGSACISEEEKPFYQTSPHTTCGPYPALHRTGTAANLQKEKTNLNKEFGGATELYSSENISNAAICKQLEKQIHDLITNPAGGDDSQAPSKLAGGRWKDGGSLPLSSVDQVILESEDDDLEQTLVLGDCDGYFVGQNEKQCFTAHDKSFCDASDSPQPPECPAEQQGCSRSVTDEDQGYFSKLSDEVILSIFQWLPKRTVVRCMHVCRRWRRLAADGRLWARVDLGGRVLPSGALPTLMARHPLVLRLANAQLMEPSLPTPTSKPWRVQYLDLSAASVSPGCLAGVLSASLGLLRLSLEALTLDSRVGHALSGLVQLKALNLSQVTGLELGGWKSIAKLHKLEHLNLAWTRLGESSLRILAPSLPGGLQRLNLAGCRKTLKDDVVAAIVQRCPQLVELDVSDAATIGGESVMQVRSLQRLEHLAISRCYMLQCRDYTALEKCPSLEWIDAFGLLPPLTVSLLQSQLPRIKFNKFMHSSIARPTVGNRRTSIWGLRTRD